MNITSGARMPWRNLILLATPLLMGIVSVIHPHLAGENVLAQLQPQVGLWLAVHMIQLILIGLLGAVIWLLVDGLEGGAARVARLAVVPFLVFYTSFDSIVGLSTGILVSLAQRLPAQDQTAAAVLIQRFWDARFEAPIGPVILIADLAWVTAMIASAVALRRAGEARLSVGLLVLAGLAFGIDHPFPFGTVGMLSLLLGVLLSQRRASARRRTSAATSD